jgi:hypothetical protein
MGISVIRQTPAMLVRVCVALVLLTSLLVGCWENLRVHESGIVEGFEVGASKAEVFDLAIQKQRAGQLRALSPLGLPPTTSAERYSGNPILPGDFEHVAVSDKWHLGRPECNCWFVLVFQENRLSRIEEHEWTGPTE